MKLSRVLFLTMLVCFEITAAPIQQSPALASKVTAVFLTADPVAVDLWPCFSPDAKSVVFSRSMDGGKTWELFVVPVKGGEPQKFARSPLPAPISETRADWSNRTNVIAFTGTSSLGKNDIWLINGDGTNPRALTIAGLSNKVFYPSWYPDGEQIAVLDVQDGVIKRVNLKQGIVTSLTKHEQVEVGMPNVSPDGKSVAMAAQKNVGQSYNQDKNNIWLIDDAGALRTLEIPPLQGRAPSWSPDGRWIVFESNRGDETNRLAIFMAHPDGSGVTQLTDYELNANHAVWSRDGTKIVFSAERDGRNKFSIAMIEAPKID